MTWSGYGEWLQVRGLPSFGMLQVAPVFFFFASSYIVLGRRLGKDTTQPSYPCKLSSTHPVLHITKPGAVCSFCLKLHRGMDMHREYIALSNRR